MGRGFKFAGVAHPPCNFGRRFCHLHIGVPTPIMAHEAHDRRTGCGFHEMIKRGMAFARLVEPFCQNGMIEKKRLQLSLTVGSQKAGQTFQLLLAVSKGLLRAKTVFTVFVRQQIMGRHKIRIIRDKFFQPRPAVRTVKLQRMHGNGRRRWLVADQIRENFTRASAPLLHA